MKDKLIQIFVICTCLIALIAFCMEIARFFVYDNEIFKISRDVLIYVTMPFSAVSLYFFFRFLIKKIRNK